MPIENYDIVGSYNNQRISSIDSERSVNLFEYVDPLGKKEKSLLSTSGLLSTGSLFNGSANGYRAQFVVNLGSFQLMFVVIGSNVYLMNKALSVTRINTSPLTFNVGYVGIDANNGGPDGGVQVIFVDGTNGYIYNVKTGVWLPITDPNFPVNPIDVCYIDGFFIVANGNTSSFQMSELNNGFLWGTDAPTPNGNTFTMAALAVNIQLTSGTYRSYQLGTAVEFSGGSLPVEFVPGTTYYIVFTNPTLNIVQVSATIGGLPIESTSAGSGNIANNGQLQLGNITSHPGTIVACRTLHRRIFFFSQYYTEVWENLGSGTNLPIRRNNSVLMEYGTPAIGSVATGFDKMFFLSQDRDGLGAVMEVVGTESMPVSTRALDFALAQYISNPLTGVDDARGFLIKENGLIFYRLNFTKANHTYVYGVNTSDPQNLRWHEEEMLDGSRHVAQTHGFFYGQNYVGNYLTPKLYTVDDSYFTNDGEAIKRMRIGRPFMPPTSQRLRVDRWQLDLLQGQLSDEETIVEEVNILTEDLLMLLTEDGIPLITEQGAVIYDSNLPPTVFLSISKDGGQSYGYRTQALMGNVGQRTFRTVWRKLGTTKRGQAFVPRVEFYNKTPFIILGATWFYEVLPE